MGRSAEVKDVLIDFFGVLIGVALALLWVIVFCQVLFPKKASEFPVLI